MKQLWLSAVAGLLGLNYSALSQINYTANDFGRVPAYNGFFLYGINGGWYGNSWSDQTLADISVGNPAKNIKGLGIRTSRPPLSEEFLENWGYDIRIAEMNYNAALGVRDNVVILDKPVAAHKDSSTYGGCGEQSKLFRNMYSPIWDGGANGTPVNDDNYYALYVYKIVNKYKAYTKFWEVINEPDYDAGVNGWKLRGQPGNWWDNNPPPCELTNMKAPIFHYVRLLRISYEVIKSIDSTAYVTTGGIGYASFLDAVMRNTDNPVDGSVSSEYPLKGGAYFDVMSYHSYPMYNLAHWDNSINGWVFNRHSDAAINVLVEGKYYLDSLLGTYGYNNITYPKKIFICTENNIPRKQVGTYIGGDEVQKNYILKALILSQKNEIRQLYLFLLGDSKYDWETTSDPYHFMGLYKKLEGIGPLTNGGVYNQQYNDGGIAFKTCSDILRSLRYDPVRTAAMQLPAAVEGAAFTDGVGNYTYTLWAKTSIDQSEIASATYTFPPSLNVAPLLDKREWDYTNTGITTSIPRTNISLTGSPIFLSENFQFLPLKEDSTRRRNTRKQFAINVYPNPAKALTFIKFTLQSPSTVQVKIYNAEGKWIMNAFPSKQFKSGDHVVQLNGTERLAAGLYYYRFESDIFQITDKFVIAR